MKIFRQNNNVGFKKFSEENDLELNIIERAEEDHSFQYGKYYVSWTRVTIAEKSVTRSCGGDGASETEAVKVYISKVQGQTIQVYDSTFSEKKELVVPSGLYFDFEEDELK